AISPAARAQGIGFVTSGTLARGSMTGDAPKPQIENVSAADYMHDGSSLAIIRVIPSERICQLEFPINTTIYRGPFLSDLRFSPDDKYLAFIEHENPMDDRGSAVIIGTDGSKVATGPLRDSHRGLAWSPSGNEVWTTAPLFDGGVQALDLRGRVREVLHIPRHAHPRDVAADGRLLLEQGSTRRGMVVVSDNGVKSRDLTWLDNSAVHAISNDGRMLLFDDEATRGARVFVRNVDGSPAIEVGPGSGLTISP